MWKPRYYNLLTEKILRKFTFLKYSFFENGKYSATVNLGFSLQITFLDDIFFINFSLSNSIISVKNLIKWKRGFEIFLIDYWAIDVGKNNITGKYQRTLVSVPPNLS